MNRDSEAGLSACWGEKFASEMIAIVRWMMGNVLDVIKRAKTAPGSDQCSSVQFGIVRFGSIQLRLGLIQFK